MCEIERKNLGHHAIRWHAQILLMKGDINLCSYIWKFRREHCTVNDTQWAIRTFRPTNRFVSMQYLKIMHLTHNMMTFDLHDS